MQDSSEFRTNRDLFSNHYLDNNLRRSDAWESVDQATLQDAYDEIAELWEGERDLVAERNESQLEEKFIRPMFRLLDISYEVEESVEKGARRPDYGFFESKTAADKAFQRRKEGGDFYANAVAVGDAKYWDRKLDTRGKHQHDFQNPSYQIHVYLQETPTTWAVLTNGRHWRLYYGPTSHRLDSYYEVDLPAVLESGDLEAFKCFYLFFRHEAFLPDGTGDCFLDDVYDESNIFAQELGDDLQDNIYEAIKILAEGFLNYSANDLDREHLSVVHDSSLIYLYRLIFVLYAESEGRNLLDTDNEIYEQSYSLNTIKQEVAEELDSDNPQYQDWEADLWNQIDKLFHLIDQGSASRNIPPEDLHIPAYNGGLFRTNPDPDDSREARFLASNQVGDTYLAQVIELLTRSRTGSGGKSFVDYSSLGVRNLGSIYEGLLEYQLNVADEPLSLDDGEYVLASEAGAVVVQSGEVYLTTDSGERKATGSYYTPEYVVEYIVENTLEPLVEDIREDLIGSESYGEGGFAAEFAERIFELKVLDPAMGSGHFLTNTIDYLAREIIDAQERQAEQQGVETVGEGRDINWARRQVAQQCIYGVDVNPLAVELAKVSLWLRTLAAEQPLAFLDHHLKTGNSLVGSDIEDIDELETDATEGPNASLADFGVVHRGTIDHLMDIYEEFIAIENTDLADVKEMERRYREIERDDLRTRLVAMANVETAEDFGLDLPGGAYERMARALESETEWTAVEDTDWFRGAQALATDHDFLHWKLEFPEVFYTVDGSDKANPGFDAVVGNPPYIDSEHMVENMSEIRNYIEKTHKYATGNWDIFCVFIEASIEIAKEGGHSGQIVPNKLLAAKYARETRENLSEYTIRSIRDYSKVDVFEVDTYPIVVLVEKSQRVANTKISKMVGRAEPFEMFSDEVDSTIFSDSASSSWSSVLHPAYPVLSKFEESESISVDVIGGATVSEAYEIKEIVTELDDLVSGDEDYYKLVNTGTIEEYLSKWGQQPTNYIKDQYEKPVVTNSDLKNVSKRREEQSSTNKIIIGGMGKTVQCFYDHSSVYLAGKSTSIIQTENTAIAALLNSTVSTAFLQMLFQDLGMSGGYIGIGPPQVREILSRLSVAGSFQHLAEEDRLPELAESMGQLKQERSGFHLSLADYLGNYADGETLGERYQPPAGLADSILTATAADHESLRIGTVSVASEGPKLVVRATARYKPENPDEHETDRWGYTETEPLPAMEFVGLSEVERGLIEAFVPYAVNNGDGFREQATKNISPLDRLEVLTLPKLADVEGGLKRYLQAEDHAAELDEKIEKTDKLIDQIVYQLYGLTDEEIEIVEEAVDD